MQPHVIQTRNRSQDEPMAEIESGETYSGIKFKGLNDWITEVYNRFLIASRGLLNKSQLTQFAADLAVGSAFELVLNASIFRFVG